MVKRLTKHGNSYALVIDRPIMDLLEMNPETLLQVTTDGKCLVIRPASEADRERRFQEGLKEGHRRFGRMLKRLAD
ncbi:MAG: AbrB/MazE/SpoVT family DNA-binding domain-containing protein [Candidatus Sumerlaeota bacterium]|nr:AbrB/MazE/SpoVT family DNA-binding domain-containing protein [Candidatus Sumerlaeota bacterium]